jgi:putative transposase
MVDSRYKTSASCVYSLKYHLVWCPKVRRKVLVGRIEARLRELLYEKANDIGVQIEALEITPVLPCTSTQGRCAAGTSVPDHVHLFVSADPTEAPQRLANQFKGYTSRILRQEFASLKFQLPTLWSRSYYVGSVGHVSEDSVKK